MMISLVVEGSGEEPTPNQRWGGVGQGGVRWGKVGQGVEG